MSVTIVHLPDGGATFNHYQDDTQYRIFGGNGYNQIVVGGGGTLANDTIIGGPNGNYILAFDGNDLLRGGAGNDHIIHSGAGKAKEDGGAGNDFLQESGGHRSILDGGSGNDTLIGSGTDVEIGGPGADVFGVMFPDGSTNVDVTLRDFNVRQGDTLTLHYLKWFDGTSFVRPTESDIQVADKGKELIIHTGNGDALIHGNFHEIALIGVHEAIVQGIITL